MKVMNMSQQEQRGLIDWGLAKYGGIPHCPMCKEGAWDTHGIVLDGYPLVRMKCGVCAHVVLFDAVQMGADVDAWVEQP